MFQLRSIILCLLGSLLVSSSSWASTNYDSPSLLESDFTTRPSWDYLLGDEDPWPLIDLCTLRKVITGTWVTNDQPMEYYRFKVAREFSDCTLTVKIFWLGDDGNKVKESYISWGEHDHLGLVTVIKRGGRDYVLRVNAYDCRQSDLGPCQGTSRNVVLQLKIISEEDRREIQTRLLQKI